METTGSMTEDEARTYLRELVLSGNCLLSDADEQHAAAHAAAALAVAGDWDIPADPDYGPYEPQCWGFNSYEHHKGACQHFAEDEHNGVLTSWDVREMEAEAHGGTS